MARQSSKYARAALQRKVTAGKNQQRAGPSIDAVRYRYLTCLYLIIGFGFRSLFTFRGATRGGSCDAMLSSALESLTGGDPHAPLPRWVVPCIFLFAVFLRVAVSLHPYSGEGRPPMFGDYEAQRHWMEITLHTPLGEWYRQTPSNDLGYWGLDYPPLTAYQSWAYGRVVAAFEPAAVALGTSRGHETPSSRLLMRWSVVVSDLIFFFPGVYAFVRAFYAAPRASAAREPPARTSWALAVALVAPAGVLVDHGHFQYNGISLGLVAAAAAAVVSDRDLLGAALFSLALNHKQMSLYYAPAFFAHMLGKCLRRETNAGRAFAVARLGAVVLGVFAILWAPFALAKGAEGADGAGVEGLLAVLRRLAPFQRGIYEDYVSNFYCATNPVFRWKSLPVRVSARLALALTATAFAPSVAHQMARPSAEGFVWCLANTAWAFFLFSFQAHEKSALLPLLPVTLLSLRAPDLVAWLPPIVCFSMWPLLRRDGLAVAYVASVAVFCALVGGGAPGKKADEKPANVGAARRVAPIAGIATAAAAHLAAATIPPPRAYPHLHDLVFSVVSFVSFAGAAAASNWRQWKVPAEEPRARGSAGAEKAHVE